MKGLMTRRGWLRILGASTLGGLLGGVTSPAAARGICQSLPPNPNAIFPTLDDSPEVILEKLMLGNTRYVTNNPFTHLRSAETTIEITTDQDPPVMILSCADARVVPEYIFDQPRVKLFVCRVAGNIATDELIGSLEYGVGVLGANRVPAWHGKLLIVLGHSNCGAVSSTIRLLRGTPPFPPDVLGSKIPTILAKIRPSVERAIAQSPLGISDPTLLRSATDQVARDNAGLLAAQQPILAPRVQDRRLGVVAAYYDIDTGLVTIL